MRRKSSNPSDSLNETENRTLSGVIGATGESKSAIETPMEAPPNVEESDPEMPAQGLLGIWINDRIAKVNEEMELLSIPFDYEGVRRLMDAMNWSFDAGTVTQTALQLARMRANVDKEKTPYPTDEDFVKALALTVQGAVYASLPRGDFDPKDPLWEAWLKAEESDLDQRVERIRWKEDRDNPDLVKLLPWNKAEKGKRKPTDPRLIEILKPATDELETGIEDSPARYKGIWETRMNPRDWPEQLKGLKTGGGLTVNEAHFLVYWWNSGEKPKERLDLSRFQVMKLRDGFRVLQERDRIGRWRDVSFLPDDSSKDEDGASPKDAKADNGQG